MYLGVLIPGFTTIEVLSSSRRPPARSRQGGRSYTQIIVTVGDIFLSYAAGTTYFSTLLEWKG